MCVVLILLSMISVDTHAQEAVTSPRSGRWQQWYADFAANQYVIEFPFTAENAGNLTQHLQRHRFQIIYVSAQSLTQAGTPYIRVGFFSDRSRAQEQLKATNFIYREQRVARITEAEHDAVMATLAAQQSFSQSQPSANNAYFVFAVSADADTFSPIAAKAVLENAKKLYIDKHYEQAAQHYRLLSIIADDTTAAWATELMGLCYERLGAVDMALQSYRQVVEKYPNSSGISRVQQRLRGLETAALDDSPSLRSASSQENTNNFFTRGVVGQSMRELTRSVNGSEQGKTLSLLSTDWDVRSSGQWNGHDLRVRFNDFWLKDQLNSEDSEVRIKRLYVDYEHQASGIRAAIGRQKNFDAGVPTSFDGLGVRYPLWHNVEIAATVGKPVYYSDVYDKLDYFFYSTNLHWDINQSFQINSYYIVQTVNSVTDRQGLGVRGQYDSSALSTAVTVDYDTAFSELNNLLWTFNYNINQAMSVAVLYGQQRSPYLTASNILIGQADLDLDFYLQSKTNKDNLLDDALARTSTNQYYSLTFNARLSDRLRLITDYYDSTLTDIPSPELLLGLPTTGVAPSDIRQQNYGLQLLFDNFFYHNDSTGFGLRRSAGDTSHTTQVFLNERLRLGSSLVISPKLLYANVQYDSLADDQQQWRYSLTVDYKPFRNTELSLEAGNESISIGDTKLDFNSRYFYLGYRVNF